LSAICALLVVLCRRSAYIHNHEYALRIEPKLLWRPLGRGGPSHFFHTNGNLADECFGREHTRNSWCSSCPWWFELDAPPRSPRRREPRPISEGSGTPEPGPGGPPPNFSEVRMGTWQTSASGGSGTLGVLRALGGSRIGCTTKVTKAEEPPSNFRRFEWELWELRPGGTPPPNFQRFEWELSGLLFANTLARASLGRGRGEICENNLRAFFITDQPLSGSGRGESGSPQPVAPARLAKCQPRSASGRTRLAFSSAWALAAVPSRTRPTMP
jgi:hypothetical protein